jgi:hypothetical protein
VVVHVVLFRPKAGLAEDRREEMFDALRAAAAGIPDVRRFYVGERVTHGAAYEKLPVPDFPFAAVVEFDDLAGLQAYLRHPLHEKLGALFYALQDAALAYDYEVSALSS